MDIEQLAGTKLGNYEIESLLGKGGMGVVYKARQVSLNRPVALKILPPTLSSDSSFVKRFHREAEAIARLHHANIVQVYDIGEDKDLHFFSMEYMEGQTLDEILKEKGRLDIDEAIRIVIQAAQGIEHAHKNGILHRDIKPSNIILDESGTAKVMDFGLARSSEERSRLTQSGTLMGTLDYMSPEQCRGDELDGRTDIYSLGVVLYEALSGRTPFEAPNEVALINKIINEDLPDVQTLNPDVPSSLNKIILKAMAKDKENRYSEIGRLLEDLRSHAEVFKSVQRTTPLGTAEPVPTRRGSRTTVAAIIASLVCLFIVGIVLLRPSQIKELKETKSRPVSTAPVAEESTYSSIAVLPFVNMSADPDQEYFCDGMAEELINALAQFEDLRVIARTSAFSFKGKEIDIRAIGEKLNVETVLEGSVRKSGNRVRITAQLVDTTGGYHLWSERYDKKLDDVFAIQDEITKAIVGKLKPRLLGNESETIAEQKTVDPEAYDLYLKGRYFMERGTEDSTMKAAEYFREAIEKDPGCAPAYAGLSYFYQGLSIYAILPPKEALPKARDAALKAVEIDDTLADGHLALAETKLFFEWDWDGAEKEIRRALELSPGYAGARNEYATYLMLMGRFDEAIEEIEHAIELDPLSLENRRAAGEIFFFARLYDRAIEANQELLEMDPARSWAHFFIGLAYFGKSMYKEALAEFEKERKVTKSLDPVVESSIGVTYATLGRTDEAQEVLDTLLKRSEKEYIPPFMIAIQYFPLGDKDEGFMWLEKAYEERNWELRYLKVHPAFEIFGVSSDPRYIALLKKMNLDK